MKILGVSRGALGVGAAVAALSACAARVAQDELPAMTAPTGSLASTASARQVTRGSSWMDAGKLDKYLLYVSNGNGIVNVYRYWQHVLVGELTNFTQPKGECSDRSGNVYITDFGTDTISEYAHAGKTALRVGFVPPCAYSTTFRPSKSAM